MQTFTLLGFIAQLETIDRDLVDVGPAIVARACEMVTKQARAAIGREHEMWPALAPSTIADRVSKFLTVIRPAILTP